MALAALARLERLDSGTPKRDHERSDPRIKRRLELLPVAWRKTLADLA